MLTITSRQARQQFRELLDNALNGQVVSITRRGREVARLVPPEVANNGALPDLSGFRKRMKSRVKGKTLCQTVIEMRDEERL